MNPTPLLSVRGITKSFPAVLANDRIDLDIYGGQVQAILGENGAGKSTLMKILYGFYRADAGVILRNGREVEINSPKDARNHRIGMVFQSFVQIPAMTVAENIALFLPQLPFLFQKDDLLGRIEEMSDKFGLKVNPKAPVWQLSIGECQKVELLKLLLADAEVLIFDEPTRSLAPHEVEGLFEVFHNLKKSGYAVTFIAHKLKEVLACADRISVMRRGKITGSLAAAEATEKNLISMMFGQTIEVTPPAKISFPSEKKPPILELRQVSTLPQGLNTGLEKIDLTIYPGEIIGVAGVSGNGQKQLGDVVLGMEKCTRGVKFLQGEDATTWPVAKVRQTGVSFIPEDPLGMGGFYWLSVQENMAVGNTRRYARRGGFLLDWQQVRADLLASLKTLSFQIPPFYIPLGFLSGGNIQRLILAKELAYEPKLIVAFYPTRGLDVQSATTAREILMARRNAGAGILLISEDLEELFAMSDRLAVMFRGEIVTQKKPSEISIKEVGYLMTAGKGA